MPKRFKRCVRKVHSVNVERYGYDKYNPYAVCRKSTGFYGSTHHDGKNTLFEKQIKLYKKLSSEGNGIAQDIIRDYDSVKKSKGKKYADRFIKAKYYERF